MLLKLIANAFTARSRARPAASPTLLDRARVAHRQQRYAHAAGLVRELALRDDAQPELLFFFADCLLLSNRADEALPCLRRALRDELAAGRDEDGALLEALAELAWSTPASRWQARLDAFEQYGWLLHTWSGREDISAPLIARLARLDPASVPGAHAEQAADAALRLLDFRRGANSARVERIMLEVVLPWMRRAAQCGRLGLALMLEKKAYAVYVIATESQPHFSRAFGLWSGFMREAGARLGRELPPLPRRQGRPPRLAFYLHSGNLLAHTRVLFDFLEALRQLEPAPLEASIFHRGPPSAEFAQRAAALGVACSSLDLAADGSVSGNDFDALLRLRQQLVERQVEALVWVSVALHMAFAFSMRLAPVQIWWALKYHGLEYPEIDGYLTSGSAGSTKRVGGKLWRSAPLAAQDWHDPALAGAAQALRARYAQHEVLLACLGREEKLNSEPFLKAVAAVLRACPQAGFLWTGREQLPAIQARLEALGVAARCHYIGWVDTRTYAQVMDVFLDSFPFPCAFTLYEAMAAGKAVVTYASPEAAETGLPGLLGPLLARESGTAAEQARARAMFDGGLYLCAGDPASYVEMATRLVNDAPLRRSAGEANRCFVAEFLSDRQRTARILATHLVELIDETRGRR